MKIVSYLLPALLLALAASPAQAQSKDKLDKARDTADNIRQDYPPRAQPASATTADRASEARRQKNAEERAHAERFPPKPARTLPPATTTR